MITREIRSNVFGRDRNKCVKCGENLYLSIDHIIPVSEGGTDHIDNLQTLCLSCNHRKGNNLELTLSQRIKFIWNIDKRIQSLKSNHKKDFKDTVDKSFTQFVSHPLLHSSIDKSRSALEKQILESSNNRKSELGSYRKENEVMLVGVINELSLLKKDVRDIEQVFVELIDFLKIEYVPGGFRNKKTHE